MSEYVQLDRRGFIGGLICFAAATGTRAYGGSATSSQTTWPRYERSLVLDFLASPGPTNTPDELAQPLTHEMLQNIASSGLTAVNLSVNGDTVEETFRNVGYWERELNAHPDRLVRVRSVADLEAAKAAGRLGLIYGFQGTGMLAGNADLLAEFQSFGVRVVQLTYNARELAGDGCLEAGNAGLSRFGRTVVERLNSLRVVIDLAHGGEQTTRDAIAASRSPVVISHAGCRALADRPRNVGDGELRSLAERGGVIGIYLMPFLTAGTVPTSQDVIRHLEHAVNICGEDHVGIGSDLSITPLDLTGAYRQAHRDFVEARRARGTAAPGEDPNIYFYVPELNSPRRMELLARRLSAAGHSDARIEKILGGNFARVLREVW
jgi:membrane dipeptidase